MTTIPVTIEINSDELRKWADKHADAGNHGVAHVLYQAAKGVESVSEQAIREAKAEALREAARDTRFGISRGAAISMHHECHKHQCKCGNPGSAELVRQCFLSARDELLARAQAVRNGEINP